MAKDCKTCKHAIFDERLGEYKCCVLQIRVYPVEKYKNCEKYRRKPNKK